MDVNSLVECFDELVLETDRLCKYLDHIQPSHWVPLTVDEKTLQLTSIEKASSHYQDYWYQDGQDGRETRSCFGLIAVESDTLAMASAVNKLKDRLKKQVNLLKKSDNERWLEVKQNLNNRHSTLRQSLHLSGLARLHLKQTWRHIPVIDRAPSRIGFNWYNSGRSIQKMTVAQAESALLKLDTSSDHIQIQLDNLSKLHLNTPLAKVQSLAPTMRANIFYDDERLPHRKAMNVSLPILFKQRKDGKLPQHNEPPLIAPEQRQRAVRSDRKVEDDAFLPSLRIHRYC